MATDTRTALAQFKSPEPAQRRGNLDFFRDLVGRKYGVDMDSLEGYHDKLENLLRSFDSRAGKEALARLAPELAEFDKLNSKESRFMRRVRSISIACTVAFSASFLIDAVTGYFMRLQEFWIVFNLWLTGTLLTFAFNVPETLAKRRQTDPDKGINVLQEDLFSRALKAIGKRAWDFSLET